jgi:DNA processing protein
MSEIIDLLALCRVKDVSWHFVAREAQRPGGLSDLLNGRSTEQSPDADESLKLLRSAVDEMPQHRAVVEAMVAKVRSQGIGLTTVLDDDYPVNLRVIDNLPPFLMYRGTLRTDDAYSVAVVGTRKASQEGLAEARRFATGLAEAGVTVVSGLALGIDTAAHEAALAAGGRTIAVVGTGIWRNYPAENAGLADRIAQAGAVVSQFWPDMPPTSYTFPRRNVVMSGMGQGTAVVEASATSGAKMQARIALAHGKRVFLPTRLLRQSEWARRYLERGRSSIEVQSVDDIVALLRTAGAIQAQSDQRRQLTLTL